MSHFSMDALQHCQAIFHLSNTISKTGQHCCCLLRVALGEDNRSKE